jgi:hypothetical protein
MAFQFKTLIGLASTALFVVAFQNCAPQKFATISSASEKTLSNDGTGLDPSGGKHSGDCDDNGGSNSSWPWSDGGKSSTDNGKKSDDGTSSSGDDAASNIKRAATCKSLRAKFEQMQVKPGAMSEIKVSGQSAAGPFYISGVDSISSSGQSDVYIVGSDANAMAKDIKSSGQGHVVLCGVYAGNVHVSGQGHVDVIGASVLGNVDPSGQARVTIFDQDGNPL